MTKRLPFAAALLTAALLPACSPKPEPVTGLPPVPKPISAPTPPPVPASTPAAETPAFREVPEPRLDVGVAVERASYALPAGDWLLREGGVVRRVLGTVAVRPATAPAPTGAARNESSVGPLSASGMAKIRWYGLPARRSSVRSG